MALTASLLGQAKVATAADPAMARTPTAGGVDATSEDFTGMNSPHTWGLVYLAVAVAFIGVAWVGAPRKVRGAILAGGLVILAWQVIWSTLVHMVAGRQIAHSRVGHGAAEAALTIF